VVIWMQPQSDVYLCLITVAGGSHYLDVEFWFLTCNVL
jgi:hypothetical protein